MVFSEVHGAGNNLTSTYFECDPPDEGKRKYGYSRDKRPDCVQVVIALIVTPEGLPLAYEVLAGNTSDKTTLADFLAKIEAQYGKADRIWVMDRGIPTEETLAQMRASSPPVSYLVGTLRLRGHPKGLALTGPSTAASSTAPGLKAANRPLTGSNRLGIHPGGIQ